MKEKRCYCGNDLLPSWFNSFLSFFHNESCMYHDVDYFNQTGRIKAEFIFLYRMTKSSIVSTFKGVIGLLLSPIMFIAVLAFGWVTYNKTKDRFL